MVKGAPSVNPDGRGFSKSVVEKAKANAAGTDGVISYGGYLQNGEQSSKLVGRQKWIEFANAFFRPPVAIAALLRSALLRGVKWSLEENPAGGKAARKGLQIVQDGLLDARMPKSWPVVAAKAANGAYFHGFSLHAAGIARRPDGLVTFTEIAHRPQYTVQRWLRAAPTEPFTDVEQWTDDGRRYPVPLAECLYLVNDTLTDSPDGLGVLRLIVERIRRVGNYEALEGSEYFGSMGGTAIARVPLEEIGHGAPADEAGAVAYKKARTANIESIVASRIKTPEKQQYAVLDSATYQGTDPNTISNVRKWDIEIVKAELQGVVPLRGVISDHDLDIARILGVEFVFVGGGDSAGSYGMHESKVSLFAAQLTADNALVACQGTQQLARRIVAANGLDPDDATPTLTPSPISTEDVLKTAQTLVQVNLAGLAPNHPAKKAIFDRMNLPWEDEAEPVMPRVPIGVPPPNTDVVPARDNTTDGVKPP
jgi:hypothetical protein